VRVSYREHHVSGRLALWVECAWERAGEARADPFERIVPDGCMDLIWSDRRGLSVVGPNTTAFLAPLPAGHSVVGVRLHPGAAPPLFGPPAPALRDARLEAREVWGADGARLEEAVAAAATSRERLGLMLDWLAARPAAASSPDSLVRAAVRALGELPESRISGLAGELAVSERQLRRRVIAQVGYGPKRLARVLRLRRALAAVRAGEPLAEIAYDRGYADQAHFANDCRELAGVSPSAFQPSVFFKTRSA
jgi:AraC-like DNA-binding protein